MSFLSSAMWLTMWIKLECTKCWCKMVKSEVNLFGKRKTHSENLRTLKHHILKISMATSQCSSVLAQLQR